jgi:hypothetical protein
MRVCQFRHDGNLEPQCSGGPKAAGQEELTFLFYRHAADCQTKLTMEDTEKAK